MTQKSYKIPNFDAVYIRMRIARRPYKTQNMVQPVYYSPVHTQLTTMYYSLNLSCTLFLQDYESLRPPVTIIEWLMNLGLPQYGHELLNNGWDNIAYLDTIANQDLLDANVTDPNHRKRMLDSIRSMQQL